MAKPPFLLDLPARAQARANERTKRAKSARRFFIEYIKKSKNQKINEEPYSCLRKRGQSASTPVKLPSLCGSAPAFFPAAIQYNSIHLPNLNKSLPGKNTNPKPFKPCIPR
jgi:hypothetical protein